MLSVQRALINVKNTESRATSFACALSSGVRGTPVGWKHTLALPKSFRALYNMANINWKLSSQKLVTAQPEVWFFFSCLQRTGNTTVGCHQRLKQLRWDRSHFPTEQIHSLPSDKLTLLLTSHKLWSTVPLQDGVLLTSSLSSHKRFDLQMRWDCLRNSATKLNFMSSLERG